MKSLNSSSCQNISQAKAWALYPLVRTACEIIITGNWWTCDKEVEQWQFSDTAEKQGFMELGYVPGG